MAKSNEMPGFDDYKADSLIDAEILHYAENHSSPEPEILKQLSRETHLKTTNPQMLSGHLQGSLLRIVSRMIRPRKVLEIGTFTGYSAICLSEGIPDGGILHTIECNPEVEEIALKYFRLAGIENKVKLLSGDAFEIVPRLEGIYDLVFIDANKDDYIRYFELIFDKVAHGGFILADNTLWYGRVVDKDAGSSRETAGIVAFNAYIRNHDGLDCLILPLRDGLTVIRKV